MFDSETKPFADSLKPEIIFVWNYLEWGGGQIYLLAIMKEAKPDWRIRVILPLGSSGQILTFIEQLGVQYEMIDAHLDLAPAHTLGRKLQRHWRKLRCEWRTLRYLSRFPLRESIVHIDMTPWQSLTALLYLVLRGNVFITMHNSLPPVARWRFGWWQIKFAILSRFERFHIFASNQDTKNSLRNLVPPKLWERVKVTYTAVNPAEINQARSTAVDREELLRQYNLPANKFLVFCVGQFIDRKGRWTFLEAARQIKREHSEIAFVWISNSNLTADEKAKIAEYNLGADFQLIEANKIIKNRQQLLILINQADLFVLASVVEGLPIALLEAMALGIASVSTSINAIPEAIHHLETGWLVKPSDSAELAEAIMTLKNDAALRLKLAETGRAWVLKQFTEEVSAQTAIAEYQTSLRLETKSTS